MDSFTVFFYICVPICVVARYLRRIALYLEKKGGEEKNEISKERDNIEQAERALKSEPAEDVVNHPAHYNAGKIETFDYITDNLSDNEFRGYVKGNILKYISRERHKNGIEDLKKAQWYLNRLIAKLEAEKCENEQ